MDTAALTLAIRTKGMAEAQRGLSGLESTAFLSVMNEATHG